MQRLGSFCVTVSVVGTALASPAFGQAAGQPQAGAYDGVGIPADSFIPNPGDVVALFIDQNANQQNFQNAISFNVENIGLELDHLSPQALQNVSPQLGATTAKAPFFVNNIMGVAVWAAYGNIENQGQNLPENHSFVLTLPCRSNGFINPPGDITIGFAANAPAISTHWRVPFSDPYGIRFSAPTYQQGFAAYQAWLAGGTASSFTGTQTFTASQFRGEVFACSVRNSPSNAIAGNPASVQAQVVTAGLDFSGNVPGNDAPTTTSTGQPTMGLSESQWGVGLQAGRIEMSGRGGNQIEARINRSFRVLAGSRSLLSVDVPLSYQRLGGQDQWRGFAGLSLVVPLTRKWTIEPRLAYGFATMPEQKLSGQVASVSLTNRLFFGHVFGRGQLSVGNLVGYSRTVNVRYAGAAVGGTRENWNLRGALAYELPFKSRVLGRQSSIRASYAYTRFFGDELYARYMHDATLSLGVRMREGTVRSRFETLRIGMSGALAHGYNRISGFVGVRF